MSDSRTHIETWNTLRTVAGRADFLYVAGSKLCSRENMGYIDRAGGRFVTVLPRSRSEDGEFRQWIQTHTPDWECVWDRPNPRHSDGPRDRWYVYRAPIPSLEGWSIVWVLTLRQETRRRRNIPRALTRAARRNEDALTSAADIDLEIKAILEKHHVSRYFTVSRTVREEHRSSKHRAAVQDPI
jgi:hypothetical protein